MHWTRRLRIDAYNALKRAIANDKIEPISDESICVDCGNVAVMYEHRNYFRPLDVEPVCWPCNNRRGEGYPPVQGEPIYHKGVVDADGRGSRGWNNSLIDNHDLSDISDMSVTLSGAGAEWEDLGTPMSMRWELAYNAIGKYRHKLSRGEYRYDFFKHHDPYFKEYA